ncbi:MAG: TonB-dependent receptor [Lachnospiraceae bacterium]|nr:TonB-dependent receptor [Lachnospiraceae bacterium]
MTSNYFRACQSARQCAALVMLMGGLSIYGQQNDVPLDSITRELQEIVVKADQPVTKLVGTSLVSVISGTPLQNLGTVLDVLAHLPMITVDGDAVSVTGKGTPEIYIDGRPMRVADELIRLQSDNIKRIELDMAPGAMYAGSVNAVLRITTKHSFIDGVSLVERGDVSLRRKCSLSDMLDLNYRNGNWDVFVAGTIAKNNKVIKGSTVNRLLYEGKETIVGSSQHNSYPSTEGALKAGFNYSADDMSLGGYYRYDPEHSDFENTGKEWCGTEPALDRVISRSMRSHRHQGSVYYDDKIGGKYAVHFDGDFLSTHSSGDVSALYPSDVVPAVKSEERRKSSLWAGRFYVKFPVWSGELTLGTQDSYTRSKLDYRMLNDEVGEYIPSSFTDGRQLSAAFFASWSRMWGNFSLNAGLRYEYVDYRFDADGKKDRDVSRRDHLLTPDVSLGYFFDEQSQLSVSYKMATLRPPYSQLTGSLSYVGSHEIEGGNPALRDERMHDFQIFGMWRDFMFQADYTRSIDTYGFVKRLYPASSLQLLMQPVNMDVSAVDLYFIWRKNIGIWNPDVAVGMHKQWLELEGVKHNKPIISYDFDNMISLPAGFLLTVGVHGQSSGDMHTNLFASSWFTMNASVSRHFLKKALQVKVSATDIFNTACNDWSMNTCGVSVDKRQSYDRRGVAISITYKLHPVGSKYKGKSASESEMRRL